MLEGHIIIMECLARSEKYFPVSPGAAAVLGARVCGVSRGGAGQTGGWAPRDGPPAGGGGAGADSCCSCGFIRQALGRPNIFNSQENEILLE